MSCSLILLSHSLPDCSTNKPSQTRQKDTMFMYFCHYVPHKAVAEVSKIANYRRLVAVNHGLQRDPTDGPTSGRKQRSVVEVAAALVDEILL